MTSEIEKFIRAIENLGDKTFKKFIIKNNVSFITITTIVSQEGSIQEGFLNSNTLNIIYNIYSDYLKDSTILERIQKIKKKSIIWNVDNKPVPVDIITLEDMYSELKTLENPRRQTINNYLDDAKLVLPTIEVQCTRCRWNRAETFSAQIRSSDEGETNFNRCMRCKYTWSD